MSRHKVGREWVQDPDPFQGLTPRQRHNPDYDTPSLHRREQVAALAAKPDDGLISAWRAWSDRFARGEGGETPIRDAFAAGWDAALAAEPEYGLDVERALADVRDMVNRLAPFDERDRIVAMNGTVRQPRTTADYVDAFRTRLLAALDAKP